MNNDIIAGKTQKIGGKIRAQVDHAVGDKKGEALGLRDQAVGAAREALGKAKDI